METKKKYYTPVPPEVKRERRQARKEAFDAFAREFDARWATAFDAIPSTLHHNWGVLLTTWRKKQGLPAIKPNAIYNTKRKLCRNKEVLEALEAVAKEFQK